MSEGHIERLNAALEGRYRVERQLGEGGMATVYLALDEKHGRRVALKVLKPELAAVIGSERFLKEIEVTAKLHHPHILPLHDSGEAAGFLFYVMPYVDGESLRERIDRERELPVDESLRITKDLAGALDYAHRQGIVHRDIKPSNVLLQDGQPVIADFGIALAVTAAAGDRLTATGLSIGTPLYMSPEQAAADRPADRRSDVYALACILFEMLSGEPPFAGSNPGALLARKLTDTAPDVSTLRDTVSWPVAQAVKRALSRTPADRFQTAADFARALDDGAASAVTAGVRPGESAPGPHASSAPRARWGMILGSLAAGAVVGGVATAKLRSVEDRTPAVELSIPLGEMQPGGGNWPMVDISPDGSQVAFLAVDSVDRRLYLRPLTGAARLIPGSEGAMSPTFSPDGRSLAYFTRDAVWRLDVTQDSPVRVQSSSGSILGATWTDDDRLIYSQGYRGGLSSIPVGGGAVTTVSELDTLESSHRLAQAIPGTSYVIVSRRGRSPEAGIWILDTATDDWHRLTEGSSAYFVDDILFFERDGTLYGQRLDLDAARLIGEPEPLLAQANQQYSISETGTLVRLEGNEAPLERLMLVDWETGAQTTITPQPERYLAPTISADGTLVSVGVRGAVEDELRVYDLRTGAEQVLGPIESSQALWSADPDSSALVYTRRDSTGVSWARLDVASGEPPRKIFSNYASSSPSSPVPMAWSHAGDLIFCQVLLENNGDLFTYRDGVVQPLRETPAVTWAPDLSPADERMVFAEGEANTDMRIYVTASSFPDVRGLISISGFGAGGAHWAPDGRAVYFYEGSALVRVPFDLEGDPRPEQRRVILDMGWEGSPVAPPFAVHPDGRHLVVTMPEPAQKPRVMVTTGWVDSVRDLIR